MAFQIRLKMFVHMRCDFSNKLWISQRVLFFFEEFWLFWRIMTFISRFWLFHRVVLSRKGNDFLEKTKKHLFILPFVDYNRGPSSQFSTTTDFNILLFFFLYFKILCELLSSKLNVYRDMKYHYYNGVYSSILRRYIL